MPKRLAITAKDKRDLRRRYAKGETAADLVVSRKDLGLTLEQIQNLICREKWAAFRGEVAQTRRRAANEVLTQVREEAVDELETILHSVKRGLKNDAIQLESTERFVETASDLSAAQRAKNLHLARTLKLFGLDGKSDPQASRGAASAFVFMRFQEVGCSAPSGGAVDVAAAVVDAGPASAAEGGEMNLEFEDEDDDTNQTGN